MDISHGHPSVSSRGDRRSHHSLPRPQSERSLSRAPLSTPHHPSSDEPFRLQHRRLQLRNSGFRGARLPHQYIGARLSILFNNDTPQSESPPPQYQENVTPQHQSLHNSRNAQHLSAPLSILQEITNTTRNRYPNNRSGVSVLEDNPERPLLDFSPVLTPVSSYHDAPSTQQSPISFNTGLGNDDGMKLREISGNERRTPGRSPPPLSSPLARQVRGRRKRGLDLRKTSFEASEYIEHIENELQQVKEAMHSPNTGKPLQEKLKALRTENKQLRKTINDLEESLEGRVKEAIEHKASAEAELRRKIKGLEEEISVRDDKIQDLELCNDQSRVDRSNIDALKASIDRLEDDKKSLEEASRVVERRNETLTELLAMSPTRTSPTRTHLGFELPSPQRSDARRVPRPRSMMVPKLQSSSPRTSYFSRPQSVQASPMMSTSGFFSPNTALREEHNHPCNSGEDVDPQKHFDSQSLDSGLGDSCSQQSPPLSSSRRSSMLTRAATSPAAWGLPLPVSPGEEKATVRQAKYRKTRRFESGSTQLKPLLLPTMAAETNPVSSNPQLSIFTSPTQRDFSEQSMDPTTSFLSRPFEVATPSRDTSTNWVSEDALRTLEGSSEPHFQRFDDILDQDDSVFPENVDIPSPLSFDLPGPAQDQGSDVEQLSYSADNANIEEDVTAFLDPVLCDVHGHQSSLGTAAEVSATGSDYTQTWKHKQNQASRQLETRVANLDEAYEPINDHMDMNFEYEALPQTSVERCQELVPEPLFLPSMLPGTDEALCPLSSRRCGGVPSDLAYTPRPCKRRKSNSSITDTATQATPCPRPPGEDAQEMSPLLAPNDDSALTQMEEGQSPYRQQTPTRARSPLQRLAQRQGSPAALVAVTPRTTFGNISRYTSYIHESRRDPTALARRVIANAWCKNWERFGRLSWWVLGLFIGQRPRIGYMAEDLGWEQYDAEYIASEACGPGPAVLIGDDPVPEAPAETARGVRFDDQDAGYRTAGTKEQARPALEGSQRKKGWGQSLYLWGKFSVAIMLAVGGAVIKGPEAMLKDCDDNDTPKRLRSSGGQPTRPGCSESTPLVRNTSPCRGSHSKTYGTCSTSARPRSPTRFHLHSELDSFPGPADDSLGSAISHSRDSWHTPSPSRRKKPRPRLRKYTFGQPSQNNGWDRFDDNGNEKPSRGLTDDDEIAGQTARARPSTAHEDHGTLRWTRNLSLKDFQEIDSNHPKPRTNDLGDMSWPADSFS